MTMQRLSTKALTFTVLLMATQQASALSKPAVETHRCSAVMNDPVQMCKEMESPVWAKGVIRVGKVISRKRGLWNENKMPHPVVADYLFTGVIRDKSGKRNVKDYAFRMSTSCTKTWCHYLPTDKTRGVLLLKTDKKTRDDRADGALYLATNESDR